MDAIKAALQEFGPLGAGVSILLVMVFNTYRDIVKEKNASKEKALDKNTEAINQLRKDLNRYYFGLKYLAGDKWPKVSQFIQTDPSQEKDS